MTEVDRTVVSVNELLREADEVLTRAGALDQARAVRDVIEAAVYLRSVAGVSDRTWVEKDGEPYWTIATWKVSRRASDRLAVALGDEPK